MNQNKTTFDIADYTKRYFEWHFEHTRYAFPTMKWFNETYKPESVIDFGCGIGYYLEASLPLKVKGYEINELARQYIDPKVVPFVEYRDCTEPIKIEKYDCVISLETGEHIETNKSRQFVENLTNACGKWALFSAAQPNQNGTGHINCQPKDFWINLFAEFNFKVNTAMTQNVKQNWLRLGCPQYIYDNLIIFIP